MTGTRANRSTADLFSPITISGLTIKNRIILPAMILNYPFHGTEIGDQWTQFYRRRAEGGAGLIIAGACYVDLPGKMDSHQLGVDRDEWLPSLERIARSIKDGGAVSALQLNHAGRYSKKAITGIVPVAPSAIVSRYTKEVPRELTTTEVEGVIESFAAAARRAQRAGFDAVELLGATGYLISQFLSPLTNQRTDRFGGTEEKRRTFVKELIGAIKAEAGSDYPLIFRQSSLDNMPGGMDADDQLRLSGALASWGVHLLNMTAGWHDAPVSQITPNVPPGHYIPYATKIREAVNIPVSCAVRITTPDLARSLIAENKLDMVTLGRALIADADWPKKAQAGDDKAIRYCIACCECFDTGFAREQIVCSINAVLGDDRLEPIDVSRRILVVGAGPAGMEAARILARRGHQVTLLEKKDRLGGRSHMASKPPYKPEMSNLIQFLVHEITTLKVPVIKEVNYDSLADMYDGVIVATGAEERSIHIKGMDSIPTFFSSQILEDQATAINPVVIIGAGEVGGETADYLASRNYDVSIVEIQGRPLPDMGMTLRWVLLNRLKEAGVKIYTSSKVTEIRNGEAIVQSGDNVFPLKAGSLILAVGFRPAESALKEAVRDSGLPYCLIGDQKFARRIRDAIHEGYEAATHWVDQLG